MANCLRKITVEPVLFLFMFASSLTFSAFMAITYDKSCLYLYNATFCGDLNNASFAKQHRQEEDAVQSESSAWIMRSNIAITVPAIVSLLVWMGSWGDRVGRRLPLVVPCVAGMLYNGFNLLNAAFMSWSPAVLMVGPVCSGLGGSYLAILMASYTYLTCLVTSESRMLRVGVAESAVFLSSTVSVFVSGRLVDTLGYLPVFGISLGCQSLALLYTLALLPDLQPSSRTSPSGGCCSGVFLRPARDMWRFLTTARAARVRLHLALLILVLNVLQLCTTGENDILLLYLKRSPRSWSYTTYGYFKGSENFTRGAAVLLLLPLFKWLFGPKDTTLIMLGLFSKIAGLVLLGLARSTWLIFLVVVPACLQGFPSAGLRAMMSSLVHNEEQGRLFGLVASTESLISFVSTLLFNGIYPATLNFYDGFCFQMAAFFVFLCVFLIGFQHWEFTRGPMNNFKLSQSEPSGDLPKDSASKLSTEYQSTDRQPDLDTETELNLKTKL